MTIQILQNNLIFIKLLFLIMNYLNYLIIPKKEWDRIKRFEKTTNKFENREEYYKSLIEQSQEIIKKWDDSVQGHLNKLDKQNQMKKANAIQTVKDFHLIKKIKNNKDVIEKAKELIFQDSCYGRQLFSALLESKALEEREAQLKFKLELNKKSEVQRNIEPKASSLPIGNDTEAEEQKRKLNKKQINVEIAHINKVLYEKIYKDKKEKRDKEKEEELENQQWMKEILKNEIKLETEILKRKKQDIEKYEEQNKKIKEARAEAAQKEDLFREVWRKYDDKIKCREKSVFNKIHKESCNKTQSQKAYKIVEKLNCAKEKKYNDFIETGIKQHEKRLNAKDEQEHENKTIERNRRKFLDKDNKLLMELKQLIDLNDSKDRTQSLYVQGIPVNKGKNSETAERSAKPSFLTPNKLFKNLKTSENVTSSKNAFSEVHAQFAKHASDTLRQCRYKNMARKVINDYRRINCIDENILPILDYESKLLLGINK